MMSRTKTLLIIVGLALLLACVAVLRWRRVKPNAATVTSASPDGSFELIVEMPLLSGRPPWELPGVIFGSRDRGPRFNYMSAGARVGNVTPYRLELSGDGGWDLLIETDSEGRITPTTRLVFPAELGGRPPFGLRCTPAEPAVGYFETSPSAISGKLNGSFVVKLPNCKNAASGKTTAGQPVFTLKGNFKGL
jgi:hypothetical protein